MKKEFKQRKETLVPYHWDKFEAVKINNIEHIKIPMYGRPKSIIERGVEDYTKDKLHEIYIPVSYLPYFMRTMKEFVTKWEEKQLDFVKSIKNSLNQKI